MISVVPSAALITAHRGYARGVPENTIAAFNAAIAAGTPMIELDVRRLRDGQFVVHHDESFQGRRLDELSWGQLRALEARRGDQAVPLLRDVLAEVAGRCHVDIELKESGDEGIVAGMAEWALGPGTFVITSFHRGSIRALKRDRATSHIRCGLLVDEGPAFDPQELMATCGADFLAPHVSHCTPGFLAGAGAAGIGLAVWTVNEPGELRRLMHAPAVEAVITDEAELAVRIANAG